MFRATQHMPFVGQIKAEQNVLVIGAGPIGLAYAAIAGLKAHVVVADIDCQRRQHVWIIWRLSLQSHTGRF